MSICLKLTLYWTKFYKQNIPKESVYENWYYIILLLKNLLPQSVEQIRAGYCKRGICKRFKMLNILLWKYDTVIANIVETYKLSSGVCTTLEVGGLNKPNTCCEVRFAITSVSNAKICIINFFLITKKLMINYQLLIKTNSLSRKTSLRILSTSISAWLNVLRTSDTFSSLSTHSFLYAIKASSINWLTLMSGSQWIRIDSSAIWAYNLIVLLYKLCQRSLSSRKFNLQYTSRPGSTILYVCFLLADVR